MHHRTGLIEESWMRSGQRQLKSRAKTRQRQSCFDPRAAKAYLDLRGDLSNRRTGIPSEWNGDGAFFLIQTIEAHKHVKAPEKTPDGCHKDAQSSRCDGKRQRIRTSPGKSEKSTFFVSEAYKGAFGQHEACPSLTPQPVDNVSCYESSLD